MRQSEAIVCFVEDDFDRHPYGDLMGARQIGKQPEAFVEVDEGKRHRGLVGEIGVARAVLHRVAVDRAEAGRITQRETFAAAVGAHFT